MRKNLSSKIAIGAVAAVLFTGLVGVGIAHAAVTFSVTPSSGLTDGQTVHVHMEGINAVTLATIELSECGNAYADTTPLAVSNPSTDCQIVDRIDVSNAPTLDVDEHVVQTGIGTGNRSCISGGNFACDLRVTHMVNQAGSTPPPVAISFAAPPSDTTPIATTTTATVRGAPAIVGGPVYVKVAVTIAGNPQFRAGGPVSIDIDSDLGVASGTLGSDGTVVVTAPPYAHGSHTIVAHYLGDHSFGASDSVSTPFSVINADNVSIGDVSVVEGNTGLRKIYFPVVLSKFIPKTSVTIGWTFHAGTADSSDVSIASSGKVLFLPGSTTAVVNYVTANVIGDTTPEANEQFSIDLSLLGTKSRDFEIRRGRGTGTIIDDDTNPVGLAVSIGDASIQEGDASGGHYVKLPVTLSDVAFVPVTVTVLLSSTDSLHLARTKGGDWAGLVTRTIKFLPGVLRKNLGILEYPDLKDEGDMHITAQILSVSPSSGVAIGRGSGTATIMSDE